ncbi:MAG: PKD domain-containing protein, partial [Thermoanaerobaculia bacterium]
RYYATPFTLAWDLDLNGSYETTGSSVTFNAAAFDGPSDVTVPARAQHPSGGPVGQAFAKIHVRNVAPQLTQFRVTDSAGRQVNVEVPFVLTNVPVTASAGFTDPGLLDHQTATLVWGDGSVDPQTAFTTFDEAFGDGTGAVSQRHRYTQAGTFPIALSVTDDDGGVGTQSTTVRVVTPQQAVEEIIHLLDSTIAGTTDPNVLKDLEKARKALFGNPNGNNGALDKIRNGNTQAAIAFLQQAISSLRKAQTEGANVATLIALLEQVSASLSAA